MYWIESPQWIQNVSSAKPLVAPIDCENGLRQCGHAIVTHVSEEQLWPCRSIRRGAPALQG